MTSPEPFVYVVENPPAVQQRPRGRSRTCLSCQHTQFTCYGVSMTEHVHVCRRVTGPRPGKYIVTWRMQ